MRYLLIANCIKCNAPISKNGACNHMTCTRCKAEFCWICRKDYRQHKWSSDRVNINWTMGCNDLNGDTARHWLCSMLCQLLFLPFICCYFAGVKTGLFLNWLCLSSIEANLQRTEHSPVLMTTHIGLFFVTLPIYLIVYAVIFPCLLITRLF